MERSPGSELAFVSMANGVDVGELGTVDAGDDVGVYAGVDVGVDPGEGENDSVDASVVTGRDVDVMGVVDAMRSDACHLIATPNAFNPPPPVIVVVSKSSPGVRVV